MVKRVALPSLSDEGWLTDSRKIVDTCLANYILTDISQSVLLTKQLISLPYTYFQYINDPSAMKNAVKSDLEKLLGRYFEEVDVQTESKESSDGRYWYVVISAECIDKEGTRVDITKVAELSQSRSQRVIAVNNYGEGIRYLNNIT